MRILKMLLLAAVAAIVLTALAGAGSVSATILTCTNEAKEKVQCPAGTEIDASVEGTLKLTAPALTVTCTEGTVKEKVENAGSSTETVSGNTSEVTFPLASCNQCTTIDVTQQGKLEVHTQNNGTTANGNGTLTASAFTATITCFGITCRYQTGNNRHMGTVTGSSNTGGTATMDINATLTDDDSGLLCGTGNATWEGSYKITSPDWLDVDSASATTLTCKNGSGEKVQCGEGTDIDASVEGTLKLTAPALTVTCTEGTVKGSIENPVRVRTSEVTFPLSSCNQCTTIDVNNSELEIHTQNNGTTANGNGTLTASAFTATITCFGITCRYWTGTGNDLGTITGSSNTGGTATIEIKATLFEEENSFLCGKGNATWEGSYKVTSPDWLDVD